MVSCMFSFITVGLLQQLHPGMEKQHNRNIFDAVLGPAKFSGSSTVEFPI